VCYFELLCYVGLANTHYTRTKAHAHAPVIKVITKHNSRCSRFTARCYAERGYATLSRPPVRPCATFRYRDHIGWNASKIISRLISLRFVPGFAKWKRQKQYECTYYGRCYICAGQTLSVRSHHMTALLCVK